MSSSSRPAPSKRASAAAEPSTKPPTKVHSLAVIAERAQIVGTHLIEIGENTVLHPYSRITSERGTVTIGKNCTIAENAIVGISEGDGEQDVEIGDEVDIQTGALVAAKSIGEGTIIEVQATVGKGAIIGKHCKIKPQCTVQPGEELPDFTVVYGDNERRLDQSLATNSDMREAKHKGQIMHVELLRKLLVDASAKWR